ncbi:MarR family winged helix-turn-helix transcriptional regulator [Loigolactobacillus zhaoyuanensis]|uniref:MarR family winged helix-turn-helix transcriptional regulator n=1 Tax=Loigolactobacillus zhaoyuanensis TaxID=2486017 RepID=A0ABW8UCM9_9LACO|nr:MarR family winged helix-turn-helix transcriptional regulator [Loigolactobacillus zhaoyuanensis]
MSEQTQNLMQQLRKVTHQPTMLMARHHPGHFGHPGHRGPGRLLHLISQHDGMTNAEIAEALDIRPSSVSAGLKQLEENAVIERRPAENDKRVSTVHLTATGKEMVTNMAAMRDTMSEKVFTHLTVTEQAELQNLLEKVQQGFSELDPEDPEFSQLRTQMHPFGEHGPHHHHHGMK